MTEKKEGRIEQREKSKGHIDLTKPWTTQKRMLEHYCPSVCNALSQNGHLYSLSLPGCWRSAVLGRGDLRQGGLLKPRQTLKKLSAKCILCSWTASLSLKRNLGGTPSRQ